MARGTAWGWSPAAAIHLIPKVPVQSLEAGLLTPGSSGPQASPAVAPPVVSPIAVRPRSQWRVRAGMTPSARMLHIEGHHLQPFSPVSDLAACRAGRRSRPWCSSCITRLRRAADAGHAPEAQRSPYTRPQGTSARAVSFVMVGQAVKRSAEAQTYLDQLCQMDAGIMRASQLTQGFLALVRERRGSDLEAWITATTDSGIDALARFARGLQEDLVAVIAGLTLAWSNGPVEGQVTRLTLLKRQGYGRAGFALFRQCVLQAA
jgi:hypothetical protein